MSKTTLVSIIPSFDNMGICIYQPAKKKPFGKVAKGELIEANSGELSAQVGWLNAMMRKNKIKPSELIAFVRPVVVDSLSYWSRIQPRVEAYGKANEKAFGLKPGTNILDVQKEFVSVMQLIRGDVQEVTALRFITKVLDRQGVEVIECDEVQDSVFTEQGKVNQYVGVQRQAAMMVAGRSMAWALDMVEEDRKRWGKRPSSYPHPTNTSQYLVKSSR